MEVATLTVKASFKDSVLKGLNEDAEMADNVGRFVPSHEEGVVSANQAGGPLFRKLIIRIFYIHARTQLATNDQNRKHDAPKAINKGTAMGSSQQGKAAVVPDDGTNKENDVTQTRRSSRGIFFPYLNGNDSMGNVVPLKTSLNPMFNYVVKMVEERHVLKTCERDTDPSNSSISPRTVVDSSLVQSNLTRPPDPM
ncbi:hypothetical protein GH714_035656 [Hevea brasiliensis]|uniref:Uncharacterized protein n=1 Tax=Hevea brasiliensis TaxID=3981 RepID=A0A6A6N8P2_HEVBR|nr:hypothetical protein GH714_035656 [Hevea brasiliensis]